MVFLRYSPFPLYINVFRLEHLVLITSAIICISLNGLSITHCIAKFYACYRLIVLSFYQNIVHL